MPHYTEVDENNHCVQSICNKLIGYTLEDARQAAEAHGYNIDSIEVTAPPKLQTLNYDDSFRVLRISIVDNKRLKFLICKPL